MGICYTKVRTANKNNNNFTNINIDEVPRSKIHSKM